MSVKRSSSESIAVRLEPYKHMKDSGVEWLGAVPAHWEAVRLKSLMTNVVEKASTVRQSRLFIALENVESWTGKLDDLEPRFGASGQHKSFRTGDVLFGKLRPYLAKVTRVQTGGCCVGEFLVLRSRSTECFDGAYAEQLLRSKRVIDAINSSTYGARMPRAEWSFIGGMRVVRPPLPEQTAIARFLGHATGRMERYICAKEKLIALLEEQKQVIVHDAVTGRIDVRTGQPYPAYKPSGLKWLGDAPAHWDLRPGKWHFQEIDERSNTSSEELLSVSHITGVTPRSEKNVTMFEAKSNIGHKLCRPGDLVINTMWAWMAALGVARHVGIVSPSYAVYRPLASSRLSGDYGDQLLRTTNFKSEYICRSTGIRSSRLRLYPEEFLRIRLFCPPREEQKRIVAYIREASEKTQRAIASTQDEIALLQEFRTRLIADVVTGKLDVRDAAVKLPELDPVASGKGAESSQPELRSQSPNAPV